MSTASKASDPAARGQWMRQQRQSRGWSVPEMRRHLREAARDVGDTLPANECLGVMIRRWEKGTSGVSERYRMHYCRAFKIPMGQFGSAQAAEDSLTANGSSGSADRTPETPRQPVPRPVPPVPARADQAEIARSPQVPADRGLPVSGGLSLSQEMALTAHRGSEHAQRAERRDIGEASLERLRSAVASLSRDYMTGEPLPLFFEMRRVREQLYLALDRKIWPRDEVELYFLLGCLSSLMADAADIVGNQAASEELARAGMAYALAIDHRPLAAQLRLDLAVVALWAGQPRRSLDLARSGLDYLSTGPNAARLHLMIARAAARLGDSETTFAMISRAAELQDADYTDDLIEIGGQFSLTRASYHYLAGSAASELPGAESEAIGHLSQAVGLYAGDPGAGEDHSDCCVMVARVDLATVLLRSGELDAGLTAAGPAVALPPGRRSSRVARRLSRLRDQLAAPRYRGSPEARDLDEQVEQFCGDTISTRLLLAAGPYQRG